MKYEQPYGVSDPNASYINGNPSTGTMGSIPPAASIENPQREIVNLITDAGLTPADTDLHQLAKSVQCGAMIAAPDTGTVNQMLVTLIPPPPAYVLGFAVRVKVAYSNTGPAVLNVNALGARPVVRPNGGPLIALDLLKGEIATFVYDGANFQKIGLGLPGDITLTAARDLYVNPNGSDSNDGLTLATPFQTGDRAMAYIMRTNLNGYNMTVHFADGTYGGFTMQRPLYASSNGYGSITLLGNLTTPANCLISGTTGDAIGCNLDVGSYIIRGFKVQTAGPGTSRGIVGLGAATQLQLGMIDFGNCTYSHIHAQGSINGYLGPLGGYPSDTIRLSGSALAHLTTYDMGRMNTQQPPLIIPNPISFSSGFAAIAGISRADMLYQSITGGANVTGPKYAVTQNSVLGTSGSGVNYLPGSVAGTLQSGGQYT